MTYERKFIPHAQDCRHCAMAAQIAHDARLAHAEGFRPERSKAQVEREIEAVIASGVSERGTK